MSNVQKNNKPSKVSTRSAYEKTNYSKSFAPGSQTAQKIVAPTRNMDSQNVTKANANKEFEKKFKKID